MHPDAHSVLTGANSAPMPQLRTAAKLWRGEASLLREDERRQGNAGQRDEEEEEEEEVWTWWRPYMAVLSGYCEGDAQLAAVMAAVRQYA
jgi:hypothetical protein